MGNALEGVIQQEIDIFSSIAVVVIASSSSLCEDLVKTEYRPCIY